MTLLSIKGISKNFDDHQALKPTSLAISKGTRVGIVGETGSGKSTLLKIAAGLESPTKGQVLLNGEKVAGPDEVLVPGHSAIAYLRQNFELPKFITVEEYIYDPYEITEEEVAELYQACDIEHLTNKDTRELSGGEKQRVALAKLLVKQADVLLLDEPFSNLDLHHRNGIKEVITGIEKALGTTIVLVSHDPLDALSWGNEVIVMQSGAIVQRGTPYEVYYQPKNEYVAGLFGSYNLLNPDNWKMHGVNFHRLSDQIIVRPEAFTISKSDGCGYKGKVQQRSFYGSHDEVSVKLPDVVIKAKTTVGLVKAGDEVMVGLTPHSC